MKYIGIRERSRSTGGNLGSVWEKGDDGLYRSESFPKAQLTQDQIDRDVMNHHLRSYDPLKEAEKYLCH